MELETYTGNPNAMALLEKYVLRSLTLTFAFILLLVFMQQH